MDLNATPLAQAQANQTVQPAILPTVGSAPVLPSKPPPTGTRSTKNVKASKQRAKAPTEKRGSRPPKTPGYSWRKDGAGWELRKTVYVENGTGTKERKRPYVAHLSKSAFGEMKRNHRGASLEKAIAAWIEDHDR